MYSNRNLKFKKLFNKKRQEVEEKTSRQRAITVTLTIFRHGDGDGDGYSGVALALAAAVFLAESLALLLAYVRHQCRRQME